MFDENFNVEKINSLSGCGECVFCLTKCPKCQTADVTIVYCREYKKNGDIGSMALVACECGVTVFEELTIPGKAFSSGEPETMKVPRQSVWYEVPELTEIFDKYFENCKPKEPADVQLIYRLDNETENELTLEYEHSDNNVEFEGDLPCQIYFVFNNDNSKIGESVSYLG